MAELFKYNGIEYTLRELSEKSGLSQQAIRARIMYGWTVEDAVDGKPFSTLGTIEYKGKLRTFRELAELSGNVQQTIRQRIQTGWDVAAAIYVPPYGRDRLPYQRQYLTANGMTLPMSEWVKITGLCRETLHNRKAIGWSDDEVVNTPKYKKRNGKKGS